MKKIYALFFSLLRNKRNRAGLLAFAFVLLGITAVNATTYYLTAAGAGNAQTPGSWNTIAAGGGTPATNFTTNGDIFIIPVGISGTFGANATFGSGSASGSGIALQVLGTVTINSGVTITMNGKNGNNSSVSVSGTIIFGATAKISLNDNDSRNSFTLSAGATLKTANVLGVVGANCSIEKTAGANPTVTLSTAANYEFNGVGQATLGLPSTVNDLTFSGSGTKTISSAINTVSGNFTTAVTASVTAINAMTINGNVILGSGTTFNGSTFTHNVKGNWTNANNDFTPSTSTIVFNGSSLQTITGATTFQNLQINNAAGVNLSSNITINQSLQLTNGIVTTGANKVIVGNTAPNRTSGWVNGNLQENIPAAGTYNFYVGDATQYRPVTVIFSSISTTGALTVVQTAGPHPQIATSGLNSAKSITPYWTLTSGVAGTYSASFTFINAAVPGGDVPAGAVAGNFIAREYSSSTWLVPASSSTAGAVTTATGLSAFGDFCVGESTGAPTVSSQPTAAAVCAGNNTSFTSTSSSVPAPTVKWQRSVDNSTWVDISASLDAGVTYSTFTTTTLNLTGATAPVNGYYYRAVFTNINGTVNSNAVQLTVTTPPSATINYPGSPYGQSDNTVYTPTQTGTAGGTYTASGGLIINSSTGAITPSANAAGTYTVTYTVAASGGCSQFQTQATVIITLAPTAQISYAGNPFCQTVSSPQSVTITGTGNYTGGSYSSSPAGLTINASTGAITPSTSTAGSYTVTYNIPADPPYAASQTTTQVTITTPPTATISYSSSSFCTGDASANPVTLTGSGAYTGGTYTASPGGLSIDASTGDITPSLSNGTPAGIIYTVTYTIPASGGCSIVTTTTTVTIIKKAVGGITYAQSSFCQSFNTPQPVTLTTNSTAPGTYSSSPAGLVLDASTGDITPSASAIGDYTVYYTFNNSTCGTVQYSTDVSIVAAPTASISYSSASYCQAGSAQAVTLTGTGNYSGGFFSSSPSGLSINSSTGDITTTTSSPGSYTVTYTTPGCPVTATTTVDITPAPTATISYAQPAFCQSDGSLEPVILTGDNSGTFSAPAGLSIDPNSGSITPSTSTPGTYSVSYTIPAQGTCGQVVKTTSVTITAVPTANISYAGTPFCTSLTTAQGVTLTGTNGYTGGTYSSAAGLTINSSTGAIVPSTSTAGNYTVTYLTPAAGGCSAVSATTPVTITALPTATISYSASSYCTSDAATYAVNLSGTDAYTGGSFSSSPAGLSIDASGTITPSTSTAGNYTVTYTIPASGGCSDVPVTTPVTINTDGTIALTSAASTTSQTVCVNNSIANITYAIGGAGTTGATVTGLPAGVSGVYNAGTQVFTISGTPTATGPFSYTVTTTGPCVNNSLSGTITVNANSTIALTSAGSTTSQTPCINTAITNITYSIGGGGTGAIFSGLPAGVSGSYSAGVATISGAPTVTGTFSYTVTTTGPCVNPSSGGTITVKPDATITLTSTASTTSQTPCINTAITNITYSIGGGGSGATVSGLPAGVTGAYSGGVFTISGTPTAAGTFNYTVTTTGSCAQTSASGSITVSPASVGGSLSPASSSPLTVCTGANSGAITLSSNTGSIVQWETSVNGGSTWTNVGNAGNTTLNYLNLTQTTLYRVLIQSGVCGSAYSSYGEIVVLPTFKPVITPSATSVCVGSSITLTASGYSSTGLVISGGDFPGPTPAGWSGMSGNASNNSTGNPVNQIWGITNNIGSYNGVTYVSTPANNKFMIVNGAVTSSLVTPVFSTVGMSSAVLVFNEGYNFSAGTVAKIEISTNGTAGPWTTLKNYTVPAPPTTTNPLGGPVGIDLNAYLGLSNLAIRFNYQGTALSNWALDNVVVTNSILNPSGTNVYNPLYYTWSPLTYLSTPNTNTTNPTVTMTPTSATPTSVTYTVSASVGTCAATTASDPKTITINPVSAITNMTATTCSGTGFSVTPVNGTNGTVPAGSTYSWSAPTVTGGMTGGAAGANQTSINGTLVNPTNTAQTATYTVTPLSGTCTGATFTVTVTVNPKPSILNQTATICSGGSFGITPTNGSGNIVPAGTTYSWPAPTVTGGITGGASGTNASSISGTLVNPTSSPQTATYTITPLSGTCTGATFTVTVTVNPKPAINNMTAITCSGIGFSVTPADGTNGVVPSGTTYSWPVPTVTGGMTGGASGVNASSISGTLTNPTTSPQTATYTVTPLSGSCTGATFTVTVTVNPTTIITGQPTGGTYCLNASAIALSVSATGSGLTYQWYSNTSNSNIGGSIIGGATSSTYTPSTTTAGTFYYYVVVTGDCGSVTSNVAIIIVAANSWTGAISSDWNNPGNWCSGAIPIATTDISIGVVPNLPILSSDAVAHNVIILAGATVDLNGDTLTVYGTLNSGGSTGAFKGSASSGLVTNGNGTAYFVPTSALLKTLQVNSGTLALGNSLNIAAGSSFGTVTADGVLNSGGNLTLKSDYYGTAMVGVSSGTISGDVTVERYITPRRAWRFLAVPLSANSQTIQEAWQEGSLPNADIFTQNDPHPGYGTEITYDNNIAHGFDVNTTLNPSLKVWLQGTNSFSTYAPFTNSTHMLDYPAYCLFVRGSRAVDLSLATSAPTDNTVLRTKGSLNETGVSANTVTRNFAGNAGDYLFIGNPFASSIDLLPIFSHSSGIIDQQFWVWDPTLEGTSGVGGYVVYDHGIQAPSSYTAGTIIQSGQAFMVRLAGSSASMQFQQSDKSTSQTNVFGFGKTPKEKLHPAIYTNIMQPAGDSLLLLDGVAAGFGDYSAAVDYDDAQKQWNIDENMALIRNEARLAVELRPMPVLSDTLFYKLFLAKKPYVLQIFSRDLPPNSLHGWLVDKYLNTKTAVNLYDTTLYSFTPNSDTNSYRNRFMLVFNKGFVANPVPATKVANRSNPGTTGSANSMATQGAGITVQPNPVLTGEKVTLKLSSMDKGQYEVTISNAAGKALATRTILHEGGSNDYILQTSAQWAAGVYIVKITHQNGRSFVTKLVISK